MNTENDYRVVLFLFGIQHLSNFKIFQIWYHYRLVLQFCWKSSLASYEQRTWLQIGLDFPRKFSNEQASTWRKTTLWFFVLRWKPLEPNINPSTKPTLWFYFFLRQLNWHVLETIITTDWFLKIRIHEPWRPKMTTEWFWSFLGNQHLEFSGKKITTSWFSNFLEINIKPFKEPTVWLKFFLTKIEWVLFRSQGPYRLVFLTFGLLQNGCT